MPRSAASGPSASSFWRCERCGTPNPWAAYLTNCVGCGAARPSRDEVISAQTETREQPNKPRVRGWKYFAEHKMAAASWAYAFIVLISLALVRFESDRWWPATILEFCPRWLFLAPLIVMASAAGWMRQTKLWAIQGATALVVLGPFMGMSLPLSRLWAQPAQGTKVRIMTFNQGNQGYAAEKLIRFVEDQRIQIICFQEGYTPQEGQPDPVLEEFLAHGWYRSRDRSIASRFPIVLELPDADTLDGAEYFWRARVRRARIRTGNGVEFMLASVHMPSMSTALAGLLRGDLSSFCDHITWRASKMGVAAAALAVRQDLPLLVGGDLNMPSDSTLMSALGAAELKFAYDQAGWGYGYTRPSLLPWVRIDHILGTPQWTFTRCWVGPNLGSDHLPLIAEAVLAPSDERH